MSARPAPLPRLCHHRGRNLAYVNDPRIKREVYLGPWGSAESVAAYDAWCREFVAWRASGEATGTNFRDVAKVSPAPPLLVGALVAAFLDHADVWYRKHGQPTNEPGTFRQVLRRLLNQAGATPALTYGPRQLATLRDSMAAEGLARRHINEQINRVRRVWRWAVAQEILPAANLEALRAVAHLARGRTVAPEEQPVEPVLWDVVAATLPYLAPKWRALVLFQLWGAMRPGEAVVCRPCDVDRTSEPWVYIPWTHKTEHRGRQRIVYLGPKARAAVGPLLDACRTPMYWVFSARGRGPHAGKVSHLHENGYRQAIEQAVIVANRTPPDVAGPPLRPVPHWFPLALRHTQATMIRAAAGLDAVQSILGHAEVSTSQIYAAKNDALGRATAERLG